MSTIKAPSLQVLGVLLVLIAALGWSAGGCGLFSIRDPQRPGSEGACPRSSPSAVDSVVFNFESGIGCKIATSFNIPEALGTTFTFVLDPLDVGGGTQRPDSMSKTVTISAFDTYFQNTVKTDSLRMTIQYQDLPPSRNQELPDGRRWFDDVPYEMLVTSADGSTLKSTIGGIADIYFRPVSGIWTLDRWIDRAKDGTTTSLGAVLGDAVGR